MFTNPGSRVGRGESANFFLKALNRMFPGRVSSVDGYQAPRMLAGGRSTASEWGVPEIGNGLSYAGALPNSINPVIPSKFTALDLRWKRHEFNDYTSIAAAAPGISSVPYSSLNSGTAAMQASGTATPGVVRISSGTGVNNYASIVVDAATPSIVVGSNIIEYAVGFSIPTLSTGTNRFAFYISITDSINNLTNSIYCSYVDNVNSGALLLGGRIGGVISSSNGTTALVAGTKYVATLKVRGSTDVQLFLRTYGQNNDTLEATLTSGYPTSTAMFLSNAIFRILGNGGSADLDFYQLDEEFRGSSR